MKEDRDSIITRLRCIPLIPCAVLAVLLFAPMTAGALGALSQGFTTTDKSLAAGALVTLVDSGNAVEKATSDHAAQLVGIAATKPLVALGGDQQQAQVVVSGLTPALVSDLNGTIKTGDKITASPIKGVGMKATESTEVVGTAESDLASAQTTTEHLTDISGKRATVKIGIIPVQVNVSYYSAPKDKLGALVPSFLVSASSSIAGREVSPLRVLVGFTSLLVGFIIVGIMLYAAVKSDIISIGRNPLAHSSLRRSLLDVLATSLGILLVTVVAFYLVLTS